MVASAPGLVTNVRSPAASTMLTTNPVSMPGFGGCSTSMPASASAALASSASGPLP